MNQIPGLEEDLTKLAIAKMHLKEIQAARQDQERRLARQQLELETLKDVEQARKERTAAVVGTYLRGSTLVRQGE